MSPRPQMKFRTRLQIISDAVERAAQSASPEDAAYIVEHLLFEAGLLIRSGTFTHEPTKVAIERALKTATAHVKVLTLKERVEL